MNCFQTISQKPPYRDLKLYMLEFVNVSIVVTLWVVHALLIVMQPESLSAGPAGTLIVSSI